MTPLMIVPAYGRKYATIEAALEDWKAGRDFKIVSGPYLSNRDIPELRKMGYTQLNLTLGFPPKEEFTIINLKENLHVIG